MIDSRDDLSLRQARGQRSTWARWLFRGIGFVLAPVFLSVSPERLQSNWCPSSTFYHGDLPSGSQLLIALLGATFSFVALCGLLVPRIDLSAWSGAYVRPKPRGKFFLTWVSIACLTLSMSIALYVNSAKHYFCLTPTEIITRFGYLDAPRRQSWQDVQAVYAWCWTTKPRYLKPYLGGSIRLALSNGTAMQIELSYGGEVDAYDYQKIKGALRGHSYSYYVNATVTPESCPPKLYPLLWFWPSRPD